MDRKADGSAITMKRAATTTSRRFSVARERVLGGTLRWHSPFFFFSTLVRLCGRNRRKDG